MSKLRFKEVGWNGLLFEVPEEMRMTSEGGNVNSGYLRIEMEGLVMEVKWEPLNPKKVKSLAEVADSFISSAKKKIEKTSKKKIDLKVERAESRFIALHSTYSMFLKTVAEAWEPVYIWNCEKSGRIVIIHFTSILPKDTSRELVEHILGSFRCHHEGEFIPWSALNIRFNIPASFLLSERRIAVGRTYLVFNEQKLSPFAEMGRSLIIEYFSMANIICEDTYKNLEVWFKSKYWKDLKKRCKNIAFQTTETKRILRHNVLHKHGIKGSGIFTRRLTSCDNLTWYCSKTNRIYSITFTSYVSRPFFLKRKLDEETDKKIMEELISSFKCHL